MKNLLLGLTLVFWNCIAFAGEAVEGAVEAAKVATTDGGGFTVSNAILGTVVAIIGMFLKWLAKRADAKAEADAKKAGEEVKKSKLAQLYRDVDAAADHVYLTKLEGATKDGKLNGKELREAGWAFLMAMKDSDSVETAKSKGKDYVLGLIHKSANAKTPKKEKETNITMDPLV